MDKSAKLFIVVGDHVHDCEMLNKEDLPSKEQQNIFKIGLVNLKDLNDTEILKAKIEAYSKNYDAIVINDADFSSVVDLVKNMLVQ